MSADTRLLVVEAPAKVNLSLEVLGKRPDGYHELRSVVVPVALADRVELSLAGADIELTVDADPGVDLSRLGPQEANLAYRAARMLQARHGAPAGIRIDIHKRIPIGGGLGGGSADAAAVLDGINRLANLGLPRVALQTLGAELGSDVPALLLGGAVSMEGRGEKVASILAGASRPVPGFWLVIASAEFRLVVVALGIG